jgi:hypothetical protein
MVAPLPLSMMYQQQRHHQCHPCCFANGLSITNAPEYLIIVYQHNFQAYLSHILPQQRLQH